MNRCKDCRFSELDIIENALRCTSEKLTQGWMWKCPDDGLRFEYSEGGEFHVGPNFGCVNWEAKK